MKSVNSNNKFDRLISDNNKKIKLNSLDLINQTNMLNITPVTFASLYDPMDRSKIIKHNLIVLIDSGASHSMAKASLVMMYKNSFFKQNQASYKTAAGTFKSTFSMKLTITLDEFGGSTRIKHLFDLDENEEGIGYDMIIGRDLLNELNIDVRFSDGTIKWEDQLVPMKDFQGIWKGDHPSRKELKSIILRSNEPKSTSEATSRVIKILDSKYEKADLDKIVNESQGLDDVQKPMLLKLLRKYESLFDGTLGRWKTTPVQIELRRNAKPVNARWYPVPRINKRTFKTELMRLVKIGVLEKVQESEWGTPVFIIPKKEGTVRLLTDYRKVNGQIVRKPYPIPRIADTLQQLEGFTFATALDLNMGYYTIPLAECSKDITTIVTEFGKFRYTCLPMGMVISGDIFQAKIYDLVGDIEGIRTYIDDILCIGKGSFSQHLQQLEEVFRRFLKAGLKVNAAKCSFGLKEIPYLGYIISIDGVKPDPKKIQGILDLNKPQTAKEMKSLIGMVQFYKDMWKRRSHILSPLIDASSGKKGKTKIKWTPLMDEAFIQTKQMISQEVFLTYPDWSMPFYVHADASDKQLGAVISQDSKPIAFFSRRLSKSQRNYTTTEKELLSIVECLKQFRNILFGYEIHVYSDHKNLVYEATLSESQRVMRWRLLLEEFGPHIHHINGKDNIVADTLSRVKSSNLGEDENSPAREQMLHELCATTKIRSILAEFPLEKGLIRDEQQKELKRTNSNLKALIDDKESEYIMSNIDDVQLITKNGKIYIPESMREPTLNWYHHYLNHPGGDRLANTIKQICYWKGLSNQAKKLVKTCKTCQQHKRKRKYGHVPAKTIKDLMPWRTVHADLIGPYSITAKQTQPGGDIKEVELRLTAMTMVDPATGWFEIVEVPYYNVEDVVNNKDNYIDKSSARISQLFNQVWLSRYPRPNEVVFDNGSEFKMHFMRLLKDFDIKPRPTTVENPQGNSPVERIHQVVHDMIRTKELDKLVFDYVDPWGEVLSSVAWAIRASYHSTLQATPAQLVFGRDMLFNMKKVINWRLITENKRKQIVRDNARENTGRIPHQYQIGDEVLRLKRGVRRKHAKRKTNPYRVKKVHANGTVTIAQGAKRQTISIRNIEPYFTK